METKALIAGLFFSFISSVISSQNTTSVTTDSRSSQDYIYSEDLLIEGVRYLFSCRDTVINGKNFYYFEITKNDSKKSFLMKDIKPGERSLSIIQNELSSKLKELGYSETEESKKKADLIASEFLANAYIGITVNSDSGYQVGVLTLNPKVKLYNGPKSKPVSTSTEVNITNVDLKFESEQIVGIKVTGNFIYPKNKKPESDESIKYSKPEIDRSTMVEFQNRIPIAYSTRKDVSSDRLSSNNPLKRRDRLYLTKTDSIHWIYFDDVMMNDYKFINQSEDYSPLDQVVSLKHGEKGEVIKKEPITNILSANVYTDLVGLNSIKPNGLIQIEVSHRFYLSRRAFQFGNTYSYFGFFNSVRPKITFSKIESNNKILDLKGDSLPLYTYTIDIFKYTSWSSGGEVNIGYLGFPGIHSMVYINGGAYVLNVPMRVPDSNPPLSFHDINPDENRNFNKGFLTLFPEIYWVISPHSRFQIGYSMRYNWLYNYSHDIVLVSDTEDYPNNVTKLCNAKIISFKFLASLKLSSKANNEIFFRSCYHYLPNDKSQSYFQAQLGYSFSIFDRKIEPPPVKPFEGF